MNNNYKNIKAFTLLEAVIVLGVTVIVLVFGVFGVVNLRKSIELKNGYGDLISNIKTIQNNAKNSIADSEGNGPKYYVISFKDNSYSYELCYDAPSFSLSCTIENEDVKAKRFNAVLITSSCEKIGFQRLNPNIIALDNANTISDSGTCTIQLSHDGVNRTFNIVVDFEANVINYDVSTAELSNSN